MGIEVGHKLSTSRVANSEMSCLRTAYLSGVTDRIHDPVHPLRMPQRNIVDLCVDVMALYEKRLLIGKEGSVLGKKKWGRQPEPNLSGEIEVQNRKRTDRLVVLSGDVRKIQLHDISRLQPNKLFGAHLFFVRGGDQASPMITALRVADDEAHKGCGRD